MILLESFGRISGLQQVGVFLIIYAPIILFAASITALFAKKKKAAKILLLLAIVSFIVGLGVCFG